MKKLLLLLLIGFMAVAPMASASIRTDGMGIMPQQAEDLDLIWLFPQKVTEYSVVDYRMEYLGDTDEWGGIIHNDPYLGHWGLYVARPFNNMDDYNSTGYPYIAARGGSILTGRMSWGDRLSLFDSGSGPASMIGMMLDIVQPQNKIDLFKAFEAGNGTLGLHINYAAAGGSGSLTDNEGDASGPEPGDMVSVEMKLKTRVIGLDLGYSISDLGPFKTFDMAAGYSMGTVDGEMLANIQNAADTGTFTPEVGTLEGDGISEIRLNLRGVKEASEDTDVLVNLNARMSKLAVNMIEEDMDGNEVLGDNDGEVWMYSTEYKNTFAELGLACNHSVNNGMAKVVAGLNFTYSKSAYTFGEFYNLAPSTVADQIDNGAGSTEMTQSFLGVWANVGVEANLLKWLQFRAGMSKDLIGNWKMTYNEPYSLIANAYESSEEFEMSMTPMSSAALLTFGVGVNYKNWNIDLLLTKYGIENFLSDGNFGEGLLYSGDVVGDIVKGQIKYNL